MISGYHSVRERGERERGRERGREREREREKERAILTSSMAALTASFTAWLNPPPRDMLYRTIKLKFSMY